MAIDKVVKRNIQSVILELLAGGIFITMNDLFIWINAELKRRGWTNAELARRAGISRASISNTMNGHNVVTWDFCAATARALSTPVDEVFRMAGLMRPLPESVKLDRLQSVIRDLGDNELAMVSSYADFVYQRQQEEK